MTARSRTFKLVPLHGETGTQLVDGRRDALEIANDIAQRESTTVVLHRGEDYIGQVEADGTLTLMAGAGSMA